MTNFPLRFSSLTTTDTAITTTPAYYHGAMVFALSALTNVVIRDGEGGAIIDSFEVAAVSTECHALEHPIRVTSLYADVDNNTSSCVVFYHEES